LRTGELRFRAAGVLGEGLLGSLFLTTSLEREGEEHYLDFRRQGKPVIFVFWHGQLLPLVHYHRHEGAVVLVSEHGDGEYITRVIERHGFDTVRGSSTRSGIKGLKGLIRAAREGHDLAITPDGPRGPARRFKPGALVAARVTGLPIIPLAAGASSAWRLESWDRFLIPRPFSRIRIRYAPPLWIPRATGDLDMAAHALGIERTLNDMSEAVGSGPAAPGGGGA